MENSLIRYLVLKEIYPSGTNNSLAGHLCILAVPQSTPFSMMSQNIPFLGSP